MRARAVAGVHPIAIVAGLVAATILVTACASPPRSPSSPAPRRRAAAPIAHVIIGPMTTPDPSLSGVSAEMRAVAVDVLTADGRFVVGEDGPGEAYYLDGSLSGYEVTPAGRHATLRCTVHLVVATHPDRSILAMPDGAATTGVSPDPDADLEPAQRACAGEVVRALVAGTVIPYLSARAGR